MECKSSQVAQFWGDISNNLNDIYNGFLYFYSCQSVQNLGLAVVSMVTGIIVDNGGYFMLEIFFISWLGSMYSLNDAI